MRSPSGSGTTKAKLARLEMENRALRAGLEALARDFDSVALEIEAASRQAIALRAAATKIRTWLEVFDKARKLWDVAAT